MNEAGPAKANSFGVAQLHRTIGTLSTGYAFNLAVHGFEPELLPI